MFILGFFQALFWHSSKNFSRNSSQDSSKDSTRYSYGVFFWSSSQDSSRDFFWDSFQIFFLDSFKDLFSKFLPRAFSRRWSPEYLSGFLQGFFSKSSLLRFFQGYLQRFLPRFLVWFFSRISSWIFWSSSKGLIPSFLQAELSGFSWCFPQVSSMEPFWDCSKNVFLPEFLPGLFQDFFSRDYSPEYSRDSLKYFFSWILQRVSSVIPIGIYSKIPQKFLLELVSEISSRIFEIFFSDFFLWCPLRLFYLYFSEFSRDSARIFPYHNKGSVILLDILSRFSPGMLILWCLSEFPRLFFFYFFAEYYKFNFCVACFILTC